MNQTNFKDWIAKYYPDFADCECGGKGCPYCDDARDAARVEYEKLRREEADKYAKIMEIRRKAGL